MNKLKQRSLTLTLATILAGSAGSAMALDVSMGAKAGTLGYGMDMSIPVSDKIRLRGGFNQFSFNYDDSITSSSTVQGANVSNSATYSTTFNFNTIELLADYHPFRSGLRLTGGLMLNNNEFKGTAVAGDQTIEIGNYQSSQGADLQADVSVTFPSTAPYLGFGYDSSSYGKKGLSFTYDIGVLFQGEPTAKVELSGADAALVPTAEIDAEVANINETLADFKLYPVANVGLSYYF
jgi:hypothetical protein